MQRLAVIAKLKPGAEARAAELIEQGPPFDPEEVGFERHSIYIASEHVVFVFEGGNLNHLLGKVIKSPSMTDTFGSWERIVEGTPHVAREAFRWENGSWAETWGE